MVYAIFLCSLLSPWCTAAPGGAIYSSAAECRAGLREWAQLNQYRGDLQGRYWFDKSDWAQCMGKTNWGSSP